MLTIACDPSTGMKIVPIAGAEKKSEGPRRKTNLSAISGIISSFDVSLKKSATGCKIPNGPARIGPLRDCMRACVFRSSQSKMNPIQTKNVRPGKSRISKSWVAII